METKSMFEVWFTAIISTLIFIAGLVLVGYFSHWLVSVGVFLIKWSDNIDQNLKDYKGELKLKIKESKCQN